MGLISILARGDNKQNTINRLCNILKGNKCFGKKEKVDQSKEHSGEWGWRKWGVIEWSR